MMHLKCWIWAWCIALSFRVSAQQKTIPFYQTRTFKTLAAPGALVAYGIWCKGERGLPSSMDLYRLRTKHFTNTYTPIDNFLVFVAPTTLYGLSLTGVKGKHTLFNQTLLLGKASLFTFGMVYGLKWTTRERRPDASNNYSFPSAHTAFSFAFAYVLHHEYKDHNPWLVGLGYLSASAVGGLRIINNKHWYNDVLVGAGIGLLSGKLAVLTHQNRFEGIKNWHLIPYAFKQSNGLVLVKQF